MHESFDRVEEIEGGSNRGFGLVFTAVFGLLSAYGWWRGGRFWAYWAVASVGIGLTSWLAPSILSPLNKLWTAPRKQ